MRRTLQTTNRCWRLSLLPMMLSAVSLISACATSTPIAVRTPTYHVPPPDLQLRSQENAALAHAATSLKNWQCAVTNLPPTPQTSVRPCAPVSVTATP